MTKQEAIKWIIYEKDSIDTEGYCATKENYAGIQALDMAIDALKADERQKVAYICDKRRCDKEGCSNCGRTTDIEHAKNFELINNTYYERW